MITVYSAEWCTNCKPYKEMLDSLNIRYTVRDTEEEGAVSEILDLGIKSIPTAVIKLDGEVHTFMGMDSISDLQTFIENHPEVNNNG